MTPPEPPDPEDFRPEEILEVRRIAQQAACDFVHTLVKTNPNVDRQEAYDLACYEIEGAITDVGQMVRGVPEYGPSPDDVLARLRDGDTRKGRQA